MPVVTDTLPVHLTTVFRFQTPLLLMSLILFFHLALIRHPGVPRTRGDNAPRAAERTSERARDTCFGKHTPDTKVC